MVFGEKKNVHTLKLCSLLGIWVILFKAWHDDPSIHECGIGGGGTWREKKNLSFTGIGNREKIAKNF